MPPRWLCLVILAFWLSTTGYLIVWPQLRDMLATDEPPPYTIDLADEAQGNHATHWQVSHNDQDSHTAESTVKYLGDDTFELGMVLRARPRVPEAPRGLAVVQRIESTYVVSREGNLLRTRTRAHFDLPVTGDELTVAFDGEVRGGRFYSRYLFRSAAQEIPGTLDPVDVSACGSVVNPMHPLRRIGGLRPGQTWRQPLDPTAEALARALARLGARTPSLVARVLPEPQPLAWLGKERSCLVIEYHDGDELRARTWVLQGSGLVVRQEAWEGDESWVFTRTTPDGL
jgi:hypothetical protein